MDVKGVIGVRGVDDLGVVVLEEVLDGMGCLNSKLVGLWVDSLSSIFFVICLVLLPVSVTQTLFNGA